MLKVIDIRFATLEHSDDGDKLYKRNPLVQFTISAPLYWWVDVDWPKYYNNLPLSDFEMTLDCLTEQQKNAVVNLWQTIIDSGAEPRQIMQMLPLSTNVITSIELSYREIIEVCENYLAGEYHYEKPYSYPNEEEWTEFCETLLTLNGVRQILNQEDK